VSVDPLDGACEVEGDIPALGLVAYVAFVLVAFGWRTWLQYRRTGDSGFRGFSGGALERSASVLFLVGLLLAPIAPVLELVHWVAPLPGLAQPAVHSFGIAAFALGFGLTVVAQLQMGASWRIGVSPGERTGLVTEGVFSYVRNPIFTGMLLALGGLVLLVPNVLAALAALCTLAGLELQVRLVEEPHLVRMHGERYHAYARSVGRFIPFLGRLR
jgi:protein-S-isoprenylcysteine O-methyltransferase Ste14